LPVVALATGLCAALGATGCKRSSPEPPAAVRPLDAGAPLLPAGPCSADGDCALVDEGCCGCNEGGRRVAILSARMGEWQRARRC